MYRDQDLINNINCYVIYVWNSYIYITCLHIIRILQSDYTIENNTNHVVKSILLRFLD